METIKDTNYVTLSYDKDLKLLEIAWKASSFTSDEYRSIFTEAIEFGNNNDVVNYLSDIREQRIISPEERKWFEEHAIEDAIAFGLKRGAIVVGGNPFKKYYINNIMSKTGKLKLPLKAFKDKAKANEWFKSFE